VAFFLAVHTAAWQSVRIGLMNIDQTNTVQSLLSRDGESRRFPIVAIGASAGGLEALVALFSILENRLRSRFRRPDAPARGSNPFATDGRKRDSIAD